MTLPDYTRHGNVCASHSFCKGDSPSLPAFLKNLSSGSTKWWQFLKTRHTWWSCNKSGSFLYQPPFNARTITLYAKTRAQHQKSTHTSSPQPSEQRFINDKQGLKMQILIWSQCRCEGSMQQSTLTQTSINITKLPGISFGRVLSSSNCLSSKVYRSLELLRKQHIAGTHPLNPHQKGTAIKTWHWQRKQLQ